LAQNGISTLRICVIVGDDGFAVAAPLGNGGGWPVTSEV
jgi:hypothetical protein